VAVDSEHRFEADFAGKIHNVTHETEPIVFTYVSSIAINECRLPAVVSARNCLSSHFNCSLIRLGWVGSRRGAAAAAEEEEKTLQTHYNTSPRAENVTIRLPFGDEHILKDKR